VRVREVSDYPRRLARSLAGCLPPAAKGNQPVVAVLTPGIANSAYFEHAFLADQMGAELVEGSDLRDGDGRIAMRTTRGYTPIDVLYRRVDDEFLDPLTFNADSMLGVSGIMDVYRAGGITIANAPGTGIADDKAIYSFMPASWSSTRREADPAERADMALFEAGCAEVRARTPVRTGGEGSPRFGRLSAC